MTLPGAETMKAGIIGDDCFLSRGILLFTVPLTLGPSEAPFAIVTLARGDISSVGEGAGLESEGVSICRDVVVVVVVLELERECAAFALEDRLVEVLVIVWQPLKQWKNERRLY